MKKFRFRLESVLQHRKLLEDRERTVLSQVRADLKNEKDRHKALVRERHSTIESIADPATGRIDPVDLEFGGRYLQRIGTEIAGSVQRLVTLDHAVRTQTQVVVEASRRTKVLDTLKDKRKKEHRVESDKAEQKAVDEVVVTRHANRDPN